MSSSFSIAEHNPAQNEEALFALFKNKKKNTLHMGTFLSALKTMGLRESDPRLKEMMDNLIKQIKQKVGDDFHIDSHEVNFEQFKSIIAENIGIISRAFRQEFVIPDFEGFVKHIEELYEKGKANTQGKVATYIPQLTRFSPKYWGVSICTIDGQRFSKGDVNIPFTLQSCSKPLTYALALELLGSEVVHQYVGQEPSGRNFNELILDDNNRPHNPMINAGAILVCAILITLAKQELSLAEKFDFVMDSFQHFAGGEALNFNNAVFMSERETADRNYALGYYMKEHKCFPEGANFKECMDFYFQCCSMEVNCDMVSVIAATLANGGICPLTEEKVLKPESVRDVLSLMHSCGMYDYSGQFAFKVGVPTKSGVSGSLLVVVPNVMGMCLWSPALDSLGNSCRGTEFCQELLKKFNFHIFNNFRYVVGRIDPTCHKFETKSLNIVEILFSAADGDLSALRRHKLSGMDMALTDYDGRTALHVAAVAGHVECVEFLLKQCHISANVKDRWGRTALEEAKMFGHKKVIKLLENLEEVDAEEVEEDLKSENSGCPGCK